MTMRLAGYRHLSLADLLLQAATITSSMAIGFSGFLTVLLLSVSASAENRTVSEVTANPADELVKVLNKNRTANRNSLLYNNPGLACLSLQYIKAYQGNCGAVGGAKAKKPADSEFTETFAPNCGIEASTLAQITGRLLGCETKYVKPNDAFSNILMKNEKGLDILYNKNHTEVGAAVTGTDVGSPYFWCVLFSNGKANSSFVFSDGVAKISRPGCYSGANDECNSATNLSRCSRWLVYITGALITVIYMFWLS